MQSNEEEQLNELEALAAIYGEDFKAVIEDDSSENSNHSIS